MSGLKVEVIVALHVLLLNGQRLGIVDHRHFPAQNTRLISPPGGIQLSSMQDRKELTRLGAQNFEAPGLLSFTIDPKRIADLEAWFTTRDAHARRFDNRTLIEATRLLHLQLVEPPGYTGGDFEHGELEKTTMRGVHRLSVLGESRIDNQPMLWLVHRVYTTLSSDALEGLFNLHGSTYYPLSPEEIKLHRANDGTPICPSTKALLMEGKTL